MNVELDGTTSIIMSVGRQPSQSNNMVLRGDVIVLLLTAVLGGVAFFREITTGWPYMLVQEEGPWKLLGAKEVLGRTSFFS